MRTSSARSSSSNALDARPYLARTRYEYGRALLERGLPEQRRKRARLIEAAHAAARRALGMTGLVALAERAACERAPAARGAE